jgi:hypothetical protein
MFVRAIVRFMSFLFAPVLSRIRRFRFALDLRMIRAQNIALRVIADAHEFMASGMDRKSAFRTAFASQRGSMNADWVIGALVVFLVAIYALPIGIEAFVDVDTTTWPTAISGFWGFFPLLVVIGIVFGVYKLISRNADKDD